MALKSRIERLEKQSKCQTGEAFVVIEVGSEAEFEKKRAEYLADNPEPELFIEIRRFCRD